MTKPLTPYELSALSREVSVALGLCTHDETKYIYFDNDERELECVACGSSSPWVPAFAQRVEQALDVLCKVREGRDFEIKSVGQHYVCRIETPTGGAWAGKGLTIAEAVCRAAVESNPPRDTSSDKENSNV